MRVFLLSIVAYCLCISSADAAVRNTTTYGRAGTNSVTVSRSTQTVNNTTSPRTTNRNIRQRATTSTSAAKTGRNSTQTKSSGSISAKTVSRAAISRNTETTQRKTNTVTSARATSARTATRPTTTVARASTLDSSQTDTFGSGYNTCRDAYFTCMDQFCAKQNESYRRCICSSRITEIQSREQALNQTADSLQTFHDLNIDVIPKTASEVKSMLSASEGEKAIKKDSSDAANQLAGISDVLNKTKRNALTTQGTLDIAGDINSIWTTTDITSGANIANLTGESLYNAVHAQCAEFMTTYCPNESTKKMVESAYGMYIENDCSLLLNSLDKKLITANSTIRETERTMQQTRLENYNAHNSSSINECVNLVRNDILNNAACGTDFVHCLDFSGRYLNYETGEPIYTADFYQLENQISLSGDILNNQTNRLVVAELNNKKTFATNSLATCQDISDEVWQEFMRQAIREIYQSQQERIRQVKDNCLNVVNTCYDEQSKSLKDFSNIKEQLLIGQHLELSETMCAEKLDACSNLYGSVTLLVEAMHNITDQKIAKECRATLIEYAQQLCAVPNNDTLHAYPYACRTYRPGNAIYATNGQCNSMLAAGRYDSSNDNNTDKEDIDLYTYEINTEITTYTKQYTSCANGYYLSDANGDYNPNGPYCYKCQSKYICTGGTAKPISSSQAEYTDAYKTCGGTEYIGSLYQNIVRYAINACVRPSQTDTSDTTYDKFVLPTTILADVNTVMDDIHSAMAKSLSEECDRLGGEWISTPPANGANILQAYKDINADTNWGYCKSKKTD